MVKTELNAFQQELQNSITGEVSFDEMTKGIYATDASIYQIKPVALVLPLNEDDVISAVNISAKHNISILPRGGGTSLNGQGVGQSVVIDFTKYMNNIIEVNTSEHWVRVQPGVVLDILNDRLLRHGLHFAPDPAPSNRATLGGMIGNNSSGTRSIVYGKTIDHVLEVKILCSDGTILNLKRLSPPQHDKLTSLNKNDNREKEIYSSFKKIIKSNSDEIEKRFPKLMRRVQGYNFDEFINGDPWNLSKLIVGSEGTLGIVLEAKLNLEPLPRHKALCTVHFSKLMEAIQAVALILEHNPSAVEIMDSDVILRARKNLSCAPLCSFIQGDPQAILIVEFFGKTMEEASKKAKKLAAELNNRKIGYKWPVIEDLTEQVKVWNLRKNGLGLILGMKGDRKPIPFIEDASVPIDVLPEYVEKILNFCKERAVTVAMYAHAGVGTIHIRPILNLKKQVDIDNFKAISEFAFRLVTKYKGSWSGEHGDGRVRSFYLERFFGKKIYDAFREVKKLFDPEGLMNPGVIINPNPIDQDLRYGISYKTYNEPTSFHFRDDFDFAGAVELCTGVGTCRQTVGGTMCPSFQATLEEEHSTRGRANALRLAMSGQLGPDALTSKRLFEVLDLCLSCKGCKAECPSNVDMARLKSAFLEKYHDANGRTLRDKIVANSALISKLFSGSMAPFFNFTQGRWFFRKLLEGVAGFDSRRNAPIYTRTPFKKWFNKRTAPNSSSKNEIVLFDDIYMNYHEPNVGTAAVELLESCGYKVILANAGDSQRARISHGFLRKAKNEGEKTLVNLDKFILKGLKIVVCEPSSCSALTDDLPDLIDDEGLSQRIKDNVMMIDEFLAQQIKKEKLKCGFISPYKKILIHGNCHQKALYSTSPMKQLLNMVQEISVAEIDSGCCGMAGSFGYEKEHYDLSMKIGEKRLFPAIRDRQKGAVIVACGFSCRKQIADGTGVKALHWVETIRGKQ